MKDINEWKIGDKCWSKCCCGPEFKILDITNGIAIIDHLPPAPIRLEDLYSSEKEYLKSELEDLLKKMKGIEEMILLKKKEIEDIK